MYVLDKVRHGESRVPLDELWIELDTEDRQRILRALFNGELLAEGRWLTAGHNPPHSEVLHSFSCISREAWYSQQHDITIPGTPIFLCPDADDQSQVFVDIQLINCEKLVEILDLDPDQRDLGINLADLAVDGQKMSAKVWAAMAAMVAQKKVPMSPSAIANALLDRAELWSHGAVDGDRLRKYASRFICEFKTLA